MLTNRPTFGDFKENVKSLVPGKVSVHNSQKGLKSRSLNSFNDSENRIHKKTASGIKAGDCNILPMQKENSRPKVRMPDIKVETPSEEDAWSDIEEMHISIEPDDDYEDILPKCERIQKQDIDSLFFYYTSAKVTELTVDKLPSPLRDDQILDIPGFSPLIPDIKASLFDATELDVIPLPDDLLCLE